LAVFRYSRQAAHARQRSQNPANLADLPQRVIRGADHATVPKLAFSPFSRRSAAISAF
jgi:hypothetical protein